MTDPGFRSRLAGMGRHSEGLGLAAVAGACVLAGLLIAGEDYPVLGLAVGACVLVVVVRARPHWAILGSLVVVDSVFMVLGNVSARLGSLAVQWGDVALLALAVAATRSGGESGRTPGHGPVASLGAVAPFLAVVALNAVAGVAGGAEWQSVGVSLRPLAWYVTLPLFVLMLRRDGYVRRVTGYIHFVAASTCVLVVAGVVSGGLATAAAPLLGSSLVGIPGYAGSLLRLYVPGMNVVPLALGLVVGQRMFAHHERRSPLNGMLMVLYVVGLLFTFGRGMWLWTVSALAVALALRTRADVLVRIAAATLGVAIVVVGVDAALGQTQEMPTGLLGLMGQRAQILLGGDPNSEARHLENKEVAQDARSRFLTGAGLTGRVGRRYVQDVEGTVVYVVHNSYYSTYGRIGLIGLGALLFGLGSVLLVGVRAVLGASGRELSLAFGGFVGFVRGVLSAWTQSDATSTEGILILCLSGALLYHVYYAARALEPEEMGTN